MNQLHMQLPTASFVTGVEGDPMTQYVKPCGCEWVMDYMGIVHRVTVCPDASPKMMGDLRQFELNLAVAGE